MLRPADLGHLFWLARPVNLLIAGLTFAFSAYISYLFRFDFAFDRVFWVELLLLGAIMAAGYWINDVADLAIDRVNKLHAVRVSKFISAKKVMTAYFVANGVVLLLSLALPLKFQLLNVGAIGALYYYARLFKRQAVIGNLVIAALTAAVVLAGGLLAHLKMGHLWGMILAFLITFIREVCKDVEDLPGDLEHGLQTLPILVGVKQTRSVIWVGLGLLLLACNAPYFVHWVLAEQNLRVYVLLSMMLVQVPLLRVARLLRQARKPADYGVLSRLLKYLMVAGLITLLAIP